MTTPPPNPSTSPPKTIAIIGAGPGGLVCARKLLSLTPHHLTIFDKHPFVGGVWHSSSSVINPSMRTNLIKYTMEFSDLSWESVGFGDRRSKEWPKAYPQAWQVEAYLGEYARRIDGVAGKGRVGWEFGTRVARAERVGGRWRVGSVKEGVERRWEFDYLVVATGYLSMPRGLDCEIEEGLREDSEVPILHSTQYRCLDQIMPSSLDRETDSQRPRRVLMVGGSYSGADISTLIALQASNSQWSPSTTTSSPHSHPPIEIIHIMHNRMYAVPGFMRDPTSPSCAFTPVEFFLFERATRGPGPIAFTFGMQDPAHSMEQRVLYKTVVEGGRPEELEHDELPPFNVVNDVYPQLVGDGVVMPVHGVLRRLEKGDRGVVARVMGRNGVEMTFEGIDAVINATGFDSSGTLSFLDDAVKEQLEFDGSNTRLPLVLDSSYMAQHSAVPEIALLGFTGSNWGMLEMQCRAIAAKWSPESSTAKKLPVESPESCAALVAHIHALRDALKDPKRRAEVPQSLFNDYLGFMDQAGRELDVERVNGAFGDFEGFVCSARYVDAGTDRSEAEKTIAAVQRLQQVMRNEKTYLARAVFHGFLGKWRSETTLEGGTKGVVDVEAHSRFPTDPHYDHEYVMIVKTSALVLGKSVLQGEKRIVARYSEADDKITLWELENQDSLKTGSLLFPMHFDSDDSGGVQAVSGETGESISFRYILHIKGSRLHSFRVERTGKGGPDVTLSFERPMREPLQTPSAQVASKQKNAMESNSGLCFMSGEKEGNVKHLENIALPEMLRHATPPPAPRFETGSPVQWDIGRISVGHV